MPQQETNDSQVPNAFDLKVILSDDSEWSGSAGEEPDTPSLWIWLDAIYDMAAVFQAFNDPDKTRIIRTVVDANLSHDTYEGLYENYTRLTGINNSGNKIRIQLKKDGGSE